MDTNECANVQMNQRAKVLEWIDGRTDGRTPVTAARRARVRHAPSFRPRPPSPLPGCGLPLRPGLRLTRVPRARTPAPCLLPRCFSLRGILVCPPSHFPGAAHRARVCPHSHNVRGHLITTPKSTHKKTRLRTMLLAFSRREVGNVAVPCRARPRHVVCHMHVCGRAVAAA